MGVRIGFQCFASEAVASDFYYSQQSVISMNKADSSAFMMFQKIEGKWYQAFYNSSNKPAYVIEAPTLSFPECNPYDSFNEGMQLGSVVAIGLLMAFGFKILYKLVRSA